MLESLEVVPLTLNNSQNRAAIAGNAAGMDIQSGRIRLPGFPQGLSPESTVTSYLPLVQLQARVLEATRILDRFRPALRLEPLQPGLENHPQTPLTPLVQSPSMQHLFYKREDKTVTKAYKVRGAVVGMARMMDAGIARRFLAVSTGNHALGLLKAAELLRPDSVRIAIPENCAPNKLKKISDAVTRLVEQGIDARLIAKGKAFEEAREWAMTNVLEGEYYLDPYSDPWVVAGQGTIGAELLRQLTPYVRSGNYDEVLVVSPIGGGGLLTGTATAMKLLSSWEPAFNNVNLRFVGLRLDDLDAPLGDAIRVPIMAESNLMSMKALGVNITTMSQRDMEIGVGFVAHDLGDNVEGSSGGTLAPVLFREDCKPTERRLVVCLLSGGNTIQPLTDSDVTMAELVRMLQPA